MSQGQVAQLVEQRTENPRVGSSILSLAITLPLIIMKVAEKVCTGCGQAKAEDQFDWKNQANGIRRSRCKVCEVVLKFGTRV